MEVKKGKILIMIGASKAWTRSHPRLLSFIVNNYLYELIIFFVSLCMSLITELLSWSSRRCPIDSGDGINGTIQDTDALILLKLQTWCPIPFPLRRNANSAI